MERLSARHLDVLGLIADGLANKQIATALGITPATVKGYVEDILLALGVPNRAAAVAGSPPPTCAGASHLHMENSAGEYNLYDYLGKGVSARYNDAQYMHLSGITGTAPY